jgi:hypothetical protein
MDPFILTNLVALVMIYFGYKHYNAPVPRQTPAQPQAREARTINIKVLTTQQEFQHTINDALPVKELKEVFFQERARTHNIRLIYMGRPLEDEFPLNHYRVPDGGILHAQVTERSPEEHDEGRNLSPVITLGLTGLVLVLLWILLTTSPHLFSNVVRILLFFLTLGWIWVVFTTIKPVNN